MMCLQQKTNNLIWQVHLILFLLLSCNQTDNRNKVNLRNAEPEHSEISDGKIEAEAEIGQAGGAISIDEAHVIVPEGAISGVSKVSLKKVNTGYSEAAQDESVAIAVEVHSGNLQKEIAVSIEVDSIKDEELLKIAVFATNGANLQELLSGEQVMVEDMDSGKKLVSFATTEVNAIFVVIDPGVIDANLSINGGAEWTNDPKVQISFKASPTSYVKWHVSEAEFCSPEAGSREKLAGISFDLSAQEGKKTVCSAFENYWGDTATALTYITLDTTSPNLSFGINSGAPFAISRSLSLALDETDDIKDYRVADGADCSKAAWKHFTANPVNFSIAAGDGSKAVCLQLRDAAGNLSAVVSHSIILDTVKPTSTVATGGTLNPVSNVPSEVTITGTASDATSSVVSVSISIQEATGNCLNQSQSAFDAACPLWHAAAGTENWAFSIPDTIFNDALVYTMQSRATDNAGNLQTSLGSSTFTWDKISDFFLIGQRDYREAYYNAGYPTAQSLSYPEYAIESSGQVFVSDCNNDRILIFNNGLDNSPSIVIGQELLDRGGRSNSDSGSITARTVDCPSQMAITGSKLIVADQNNSRVLIWNHIPTRNFTPADVVLGQADFTSGLENRDGSSNVKANGMNYPVGIVIIDGKLLVSDTNNHRVLIWNSIPAASDTSPDLIIGQGDFTSGDANRGLSASANTLNTPYYLSTDGTSLSVADYGNNRVLIWNALPTVLDVSADLVACQADYATATSHTTQSGCKNPVQGTLYNNHFYVLDSGNGRMLYFASLPGNGAIGAADGVFAQANFTSGSQNRGGAAANNSLNWPESMNIIGGNIHIVDTGNHRILRFNTAPVAVGTDAADAVYGQDDFSKNSANKTPANINGFKAVGCMDVNSSHLIVGDRYNGRVFVYDKSHLEAGPTAVIGKNDFVTATTETLGTCPNAAQNYLTTVEGCALGADGKVYIADRYCHRVLVYDTTPSTNGAMASYVLGQDDFTHASSNSGTDGYGKLSSPMGIEVTADKLFVADHGNRRVLIYDLPIDQNRKPASVVVGQPDATTFTAGIADNKFNGIAGILIHDSKMLTIEYTNNRVMIFNTIPTGDGVSADIVLGQADFISNAGALTTQNSFGGGIQATGAIVLDNILYIPDRNNNRLLNFDWPSLTSYASATSVIGQDDFTLKESIPGYYPGLKFKNLLSPTAVAEDGSFVWIAEMYGNRVSRIKKTVFQSLQVTP